MMQELEPIIERMRSGYTMNAPVTISPSECALIVAALAYFKKLKELNDKAKTNEQYTKKRN